MAGIPKNAENSIMTAPTRRRAADAGVRRKIKPSITTALVLSFGTLIVVGMVAVLGISMWSAQKNTRELLADNAQLAVLSLVRETRRRLAPVLTTNEYIAKLIVDGEIDITDRDALARSLFTALAGTEQVVGMAFVFPDGRNIRVRRDGGIRQDPATLNGGEFARPLAEARLQRGAFWGRPAWVPAIQSTVISVRTPIWHGTEFRGMLAAGVTVDALSEFIARSASAAPLTANRFVLYGRDHVLAHANMAEGGYKRNADIPLPHLDQVADRAVANIWNTANRGRLLIPLDSETRGHSMNIDGDTYIYLYRELTGFGGTPLIVGIYAGPDDGLGVEINRLVWAAIVAGGVIVVCLIGAVLLGRGLSAPIKELAAGSGAVASLDLTRVTRLRPSRLRELDEAAAAFNQMTAGLRWFETYVPRQLVRRLIAREAPVASEEKEVTVMFTDIAGFATLSEHMPASDIADLLNAHFSILAASIEHEHGTVDKFIGDSIMAFWEPENGVPDVDRALRAARSIKRGIEADNAERRRKGLMPVSVRIGIHTGLAIVGNIGAPGRINYTLVGDTVNVAARLEQLCKEMPAESSTVVLVSGATAALAHDRSDLKPRGAHPVRGRDNDIDIYLMET